MTSLTGEAVQQLEQDYYSCKVERESLLRSTALMEMELELVRKRNIELQSERDEAKVRLTQVETILEQVSAGLISGISRIRAGKRPYAAGGRVANKDFSDNHQIAPKPPKPEPETETRVMPPRMAPVEQLPDTPPPAFLSRRQPGIVRDDIVDSRLPVVEMFTPADKERQDLAAINRTIEGNQDRVRRQV